MTLSHDLASESVISVQDDVVHIHHLAFPHPEAARYLYDRLDLAGPEAVTDLLRRALSIGLVVALTTEVTESPLDVYSVNRTLEGFADRVGARAIEAAGHLATALARAREYEKALADTARFVIGGLPQLVEAQLTEHLATLAERETGMTRVDRTALTRLLEAALEALGESDEREPATAPPWAGAASVAAAGEGHPATARANLVEALAHLRA